MQHFKFSVDNNQDDDTNPKQLHVRCKWTPTGSSKISCFKQMVFASIFALKVGGSLGLWLGLGVLQLLEVVATLVLPIVQKYME